MYADGDWVIRDYTRAFMWWDLATSKGDSVAEHYLNKTEATMAPAAIEKARCLTCEYEAKEY